MFLMISLEMAKYTETEHLLPHRYTVFTHRCFPNLKQNVKQLWSVIFTTPDWPVNSNETRDNIETLFLLCDQETFEWWVSHPCPHQIWLHSWITFSFFLLLAGFSLMLHTFTFPSERCYSVYIQHWKWQRKHDAVRSVSLDHKTEILLVILAWR